MAIASNNLTINALVTGDAYSSQSAYTALKFCRTAVTAGHTVSQVFFYQDGVSQANGFSLPLQDEFNCTEQWLAFANESGCELVVCVSAAERRGVLSAESSNEAALQGTNLPIEFKVSGLGVLHEATLNADRLVTFK